MLEDDCIEPSQGGLPEVMQFSPAQWIMFELVEPEPVQATESIEKP
jgi:hypothetical protein